MLPIKAWEVDTGNPILEANKIVPAVAISAQKPRLGTRSIIHSPTVAMTFFPCTANPATIPVPPITNIQ